MGAYYWQAVGAYAYGSLHAWVLIPWQAVGAYAYGSLHAWVLIPAVGAYSLGANMDVLPDQAMMFKVGTALS